ncbi:MAG: acyl-CoA dehydratase activase, partial [Nitrospirota bacterium]
ADSSGFSGFDRLISYRGEIAGSTSGLEALGSTSCCYAGGTEATYREDEGKAKKAVVQNINGGERIESFLGIDIGSISTNLVIIDKNKNVLAKRYIMTAGRPIEAVKGGLKDIGDEMGAGVEIKGVATTGSGRYLIGDLVGADIIRNEITAQATAAINMDKEVDTIFEIGGQDSKYISIDNGVVVDFEMNKACAAGTGSFLEEQAERLGVRIKEEFGDMALSASSPCSLGEKCTVFMESDLVHHQQRGAKTDELVGGLSYSIVHNYINRVVADRRIGNHILFQGGVAANKGVVAAFSKVTGKKIIVPQHHEVTGAIGAAILALESGIERTKFKGFDIAQRGYEISTFDCVDCSNRCEVRKVHLGGEEPLFYGGRCEKYEIKGRKKDNNIPDLYAEREKLLLKYSKGKKGLPEDAPTIGIPKALFFYELLPLFKT